MPPGSVSVVPSWRRILVVAPLAATKPMRALSRLSTKFSILGYPTKYLNLVLEYNSTYTYSNINLVIPRGTKFSTAEDPNP
jgi:hypothetical protein